MANTFLLALDAGHGMNTPGKRCMKALDPNETREWFLNDRVSRYIAQRAALYEGFETMRVDDPTGRTDVSLPERCRRANVADADLYLSNHHNAGIGGGSGGGVVAFCMRGGTNAKIWRDVLYEAVVTAGGLRGNRSDPTQEKNYDVLVRSDMSAVLIEYGFMDSSSDIGVILSEQYAKTVGYAVADCIAARQKLKLKSGFTDVPADAWYADAVRWAAEQGIVKGVDAIRFGSEQLCTRAQAVTFLHRLAGLPEAAAHMGFVDVPADAYYRAAVAWAVEKGIVTGMDATHFGPDEPCTRGQIVALLYRAEGMPDVTDTTNPFVDVPGDSYYHSAVLWAVAEGITTEVDATHFYPEQGCTRAQMVTFLYRRSLMG